MVVCCVLKLTVIDEDGDGGEAKEKKILWSGSWEVEMDGGLEVAVIMWKPCNSMW